MWAAAAGTPGGRRPGVLQTAWFRRVEMSAAYNGAAARRSTCTGDKSLPALPFQRPPDRDDVHEGGLPELSHPVVMGAK